MRFCLLHLFFCVNACTWMVLYTVAGILVYAAQLFPPTHCPTPDSPPHPIRMGRTVDCFPFLPLRLDSWIYDRRFPTVCGLTRVCSYRPHSGSIPISDVARYMTARSPQRTHNYAHGCVVSLPHYSLALPCHTRLPRPCYSPDICSGHYRVQPPTAF